MTEKLRTARKAYACGYCQKPIEPGAQYVEIKTRYPVYQEDVNPFATGHQVGITYATLRVHGFQFSSCLLANEKEPTL